MQRDILSQYRFFKYFHRIDWINWLIERWTIWKTHELEENFSFRMPAYNLSMLYVVFFVIYLLVNLYLLMNLLLAVIFSNYKQHLQDEQSTLLKRHNEAIERVFSLLKSKDGDEKISFETYRRLIFTMRPEMTQTTSEAYWRSTGLQNLDDGLAIKEFRELIFNLNFDLQEPKAQRNFFENFIPIIYRSKFSQSVIDLVHTP